MGQGYDDALFIRLGRNIANGQWLGPYNELTLFKAPMYPVFLAGFSLTGIPFNIAQHSIYFFGCLYLASVIARSCNSSTIGMIPLETAPTLSYLLCYYQGGSRAAVYRTHIVSRRMLDRLVLVGTGQSASPCVFRLRWSFLFTVYYLTREEGIWILPSLGIIALGQLWKFSPPPLQRPCGTRFWRLCSRLLVVALFVSLTAGGIGLLNRAFYGRFVVTEMSDPDFQKAMAALQRVGAPYERPYLPLPREARHLLYAESPLFASLKSVLDPRGSENPWNNVACRILPSTCGDIGGGLFMWGLCVMRLAKSVSMRHRKRLQRSTETWQAR